MKSKFRTEFQKPEKFKKDLANCYLSTFFIEELRNIYTEKERELYLRKQSPNKVVRQCEEAVSIICYKQLHRYNLSRDAQKFSVFNVANIYDNLKMYHFVKNDLRNKKVKDDGPLVKLAKVSECLKPLRKESKKEVERASAMTCDSALPPRLGIGPFLMLERQSHKCTFEVPEEYRQDRKNERRAEILEEMDLLDRDVIQSTLRLLSRYPQRSRADQVDANIHSNQQPPPPTETLEDDEFDEKSILDLLKNKKEYIKEVIENVPRRRSGLDILSTQDSP
jgi:hypothetical protein